MSYCRWSEGDVYVFTTSQGIECCFCPLQIYEWVDDPNRKILGGYFKTIVEVPHIFRSNQEMIDHLLTHRAAGHDVPEDALERLRDPEDEKRNQTIWAQYEENENAYI